MYLQWGYLGQNKNNCFTKTESRPRSQKGDAQWLILNKHHFREEKNQVRCDKNM